MKERPILFSGPMVRAILEGRKTQTRRIVKPQPIDSGRFHPCPYGHPGGSLWVRETWGLDAYTGDMQFSIKYRAGGDSYVTERNGSDEWVPIYQRYIDGCGLEDNWGRWRPSIHMPRWASRITLKITGARIERLQDITTKDAVREGVAYDVSKPDGDPVSRFQKLWNSINKDRAPWESNPWVWVVSFVPHMTWSHMGEETGDD